MMQKNIFKNVLKMHSQWIYELFFKKCCVGRIGQSAAYQDIKIKY